MNSVGIDVPKRKSMIAVMRPSGEEGVSPPLRTNIQTANYHCSVGCPVRPVL